MFISLIQAYYAIRVDTTSSDNSESALAGESEQLPKAEALTLLIQKRVPLRPVKVIERSDDVVVIHTKNRSKRKQHSSRGRRRPSNQFRSKIRPSRPSSSSSNFGGFKDFSSNDLRFPPFPSKPPRASNKLKFSSPSKQKPSYDFNSQQISRRPRPSQVVQTISTVYGPPATSFNQIDTPFGHPVTLQQAQSNVPSYAVEPVQSNFFTSSGGGYNNFGGNSNNNYNNNNNNNNFNNNFASHNEITRYSSAPSISNFPLGDGSSFNVPKTSYGEPVRSASQSSNSYQFNSIIGNQQQQQQKQQSNNRNHNNNNGHNFPKLPNRYESSDFSTPTRTNPLNSNNNFDFGNLDVLSESKNVLSSVPGGINQQIHKNRFNKFNNFDYDFGKNYNDDDDDEEDDEDLDLIYTTRRPRFPVITTTTTPFPTTTKRSKKNVFGKRKRPSKIAQNHNLDTDDLRDAFSESTNDDFHEVALNSEDFLNFDSQRNVKKAINNPIQEIHSTLKHARKTHPALRQALGEDFQIVSIEKSLEKNPTDVNIGNIQLQRRGDEEPINNKKHEYREFSVGGEINFSEVSPPNMWNGDMNSFPRNHRFS